LQERKGLAFEAGRQAMSLPYSLNFDRVLEALLDDMAKATDGWANGSPLDEMALMNRITEKLTRKRRRCDVGAEFPVELHAEFFDLHRRGEAQVDKFGSDLAVTVQIPSDGFVKTAFFQLKVSRDYQATLNINQLDQAAVIRVAERSFVLAVDAKRFGYRVKSLGECRSEIPTGHATKQFDTSEWEFLVQWILAWFQCERGPASEPNDPHGPETLLENYRHPDSKRLVHCNAWI
jgi:hypothetical protein